MFDYVIMFLYLFVCVRKWQCNDLKSKQRMCVCVLTDYYILPFSHLCHLLNPDWWGLDQSGVRVIEFSAKLQNDKD